MGLPTLRWEAIDDSSGDSVVGDRDAEDAAGDVAAVDTVWDDGATRAGFACLDRVDLVSLFKLSFRDEISAEVLAWCVPFGNWGRID